MRGSTLRNTSFIIGIVVYVGTDTKAHQRAKKQDRKTSWLVNRMHRHFIKMFIGMAVIVILLTVGGAIIQNTGKGMTYLYLSDESAEANNGAGSFIARPFENLVLISHAIPMSIYVAIEVLKWIQVRILLRDPDLFLTSGGTLSLISGTERESEEIM